MAPPSKKSVSNKREKKKTKTPEFQNCKMPWVTMADKRKKERQSKQNRERVRKYRENVKEMALRKSTSSKAEKKAVQKK